MPANLALGDGLDPAQRQIDGNGHDANNPDGLLVICPLVPEDDGEDDTAQVPRAARAAGHDAIGERVNVGHEAEDGAVGALEEEGHARHEAEHGALVVAVGKADGDLEGAREDGVDVDEVLLAPDAGVGVDEVGDDAAEGSEDDVEEAEHGGPAAGAGLAEGLEVLDVVGAEDGIDGEFGAKGAEVAAAGDEGLEGEDDGHGFLEAGLADDLAPGDVEHLLFANLGFVVETALAVGGGVVFEFRVVVSCGGAGFRRGGLDGVDLPWDRDDVALDAVFGQILLGGEMAVLPFSGGGIGAQEQHCNGDGDDDDEGDDESHSPGLVGGHVLILDEGVEDCRHQEVCDTTSSIAKACNQSVARANDVLVEESSRPYLARHKAAAQNTDEETESHETLGAGDCTCKHGGYGARKQTGCKGVSRADEIAHGSSD